MLLSITWLQKLSLLGGAGFSDDRASAQAPKRRTDNFWGSNSHAHYMISVQISDYYT